MMLFYVYEHWRPDKDVCFWVGKGKGARAYVFKRNSHYDRIVAKLARIGMCVEVRLVAEALSEDEAFRIERERIAFWRARGDELANVTSGGEGVAGLKHSPETVARISALNRGRKHRPETKAKMSAAHTGRTKSPEHRRNISLAKIGKPQKKHTAEHNAKIGASQRGKKEPSEVRAKKRVAALARQPSSAETRSRIRQSVEQLWTTPEYRERLQKAHANRAPISEETRIKMRAAQQVRRKAELEGAR